MDTTTCEHKVRSGDSCYGLYLDSPSGGNSSLVQDFCVYGNKNVMVRVTSVESLCLPYLVENDKLIVEELGECLKEKLHVHKFSKSTETSISPDIDESAPVEAKAGKSLSKSATFPCSEGLQSSFAPSQGRQGCLSKLVQDPSSSENPVYARSISMPVSSKLVSAMKGGREQSGRSLGIKFYVKWAPEVYDPPSTSISHTMRGNHQRSKAKKKDQHKHKHKGKGKSSRGNGSERRHANRRSTGNTVDPSDLRLPVINDAFILDGCHQSTMELSDYAASSQEGKCGIRFLKESLATMQFSIAEAS